MQTDVAPDVAPEVAIASALLRGAPLRYVAPLDPDGLPFDEDAAAGELYAPHWARAWPSGIALADAVSDRRWAGAAVLELGCGLGLASVAAARAGAAVLATDRSPRALTLTSWNARENAVAVATAVCVWADAQEVVERGPWRLVMAGDVLYGRRNLDDLLALLPRLVADDGEVWVTDPRRPLAPAFLTAARASWARVETVPSSRPDIDLHRLSPR